MANREIEKRKDELAALFQPRTYSDLELDQFSNKIQRFWDPAREVILEGLQARFPGPTIARKFRHEDLHVAFGAARKVESGKNTDGTPRYHYLYQPERLATFTNLWTQYEDWRRRQDWIEQKRREALQETADEVSF